MTLIAPPPFANVSIITAHILALLINKMTLRHFLTIEAVFKYGEQTQLHQNHYLGKMYSWS